MEEETHYKRMLKRIVEVLEEYKKGKSQISSVVWTTTGNIEALDGLSKEFKDKTEWFLGCVAGITEDTNTLNNKEKYKRIIERIEEYEPYIHELLKIDR